MPSTQYLLPGYYQLLGRNLLARHAERGRADKALVINDLLALTEGRGTSRAGYFVYRLLEFWLPHIHV
jgi:hypothetical protein